MKPFILIVGQVPDPHIEAVAQALTRLGARVVVFNRLEPHKQGLSFELSAAECKGWVEVNRRRYDLGEARAVWWRVKPYTLVELSGQPLPLGAGFIDREWRSALDSLPAFTHQALWVNPRAADLLARNKPLQLAAAREVGLAIPATLVSNDAGSVAGFMGADGSEHIFKALTWFVEPPNRFLYTAAVSADQVRANPEALRLAAGIFQERVPKAYEVRATVVGKRVFGVRIDSQEFEVAQLDWRKAQHALTYAASPVPPEIEARLLALNRRLGLHYGAHDLIVTPDGETVFLEVNPLGQWLWLETATGVPVTQALAEFLVCAKESG